MCPCVFGKKGGCVPGDLGFTKETKKKQEWCHKACFSSISALIRAVIFDRRKCFYLRETVSVWPQHATHTHTLTQSHTHGSDRLELKHTRTHTEQVIGSLVELGGQRMERKCPRRVYPPFDWIRAHQYSVQVLRKMEGQGVHIRLISPCRESPHPAVCCLIEHIGGNFTPSLMLRLKLH